MMRKPHRILYLEDNLKDLYLKESSDKEQGMARGNIWLSGSAIQILKLLES
jgi:hypothetical protein